MGGLVWVVAGGQHGCEVIVCGMSLRALFRCCVWWDCVGKVDWSLRNLVRVLVSVCVFVGE
jgi:hypothetical protein